MVNDKRIHITSWLLLSLVVLSATSPGYSHAAEKYFWSFKEKKNYGGWIVQGAPSDFDASEGMLRIGKARKAAIVSPSNLQIRTDIPCMINVRLRSKAYTTFFLGYNPNYFSHFLYDDQSLSRIKPRDDFYDYKILMDFDDASQSILHGIDSISIVFRDVDSLEIESIGFSVPDTPELVWTRVKQLCFAESLITNKTINVIETPQISNISILIFAYGLAFICSVILLLSWNISRGRDASKQSGSVRDRTKPDGMTFRHAAIIGFVISALIVSLKMDCNWLMIFREDMAAFSGRNVAETIDTIPSINFYEYLLFVKKHLPPGANIRPLISPAGESHGKLAAIGQYYVLPFETREGAEYIGVYDPQSNFDPIRKMLTAGGERISPVEPIASLAPGAELYKIVR